MSQWRPPVIIDEMETQKSPIVLCDPVDKRNVAAGVTLKGLEPCLVSKSFFYEPSHNFFFPKYKEEILKEI